MLGKDDDLPRLIGGGNPGNIELADRIVDMCLAHAAMHAVNLNVCFYQSAGIFNRPVSFAEKTLDDEYRNDHQGNQNQQNKCIGAGQ